MGGPDGVVPGLRGEKPPRSLFSQTLPPPWLSSWWRASEDGGLWRGGGPMKMGQSLGHHFMYLGPGGTRTERRQIWGFSVRPWVGGGEAVPRGVC